MTRRCALFASIGLFCLMSTGCPLDEHGELTLEVENSDSVEYSVVAVEARVAFLGTDAPPFHTSFDVTNITKTSPITIEVTNHHTGHVVARKSVVVLAEVNTTIIVSIDSKHKVTFEVKIDTGDD